MMHRRVINRVLLALVVLLAGLVGWLLQTPSTAPGAPATPPVLTDLSGPVDTLHVRRGDQLVTLVRQNGRWRLTAPVAAPADPAHLDVLLALAHAHAVRRLADNDIPSATSGTGHDAVVVRYNNAPPIRIGAAGPEPGTYYVRTAHDLLLVALPHYNALHWHWTDWLDRSLIPPGHELSRLVLPRYTLTHQANGHWQVAPADTRTGAAAWATIAAWQRAQALTIVPADASRERIARITLEYRNAPTAHLDVIETAPHLILRDARLGVDYHLAGNRVAPLLSLKHPGL